jgi:SAM-dependent methyltransferase
MDARAYDEMAAVQDTHWWYSARREILRAQLRQLHLDPQAAILEVGSGTGANLNLLVEFGSVTGIEMCREAIHFAQRCESVRSGRARLVQGRCPQDLLALGERYDAVCLFDVLEHLDDDIAGLRAICEVLRPGGKIVLTVPAYPWLWSAHDVQLHHRRRYTLRSLAGVFEQAGLKTQALSHFNTLLFPLALAERAFERATGSNQLATSIPPAAVNGALRTIFASERKLLGKVPLPFGLSLFAVAKVA